MNGGRWLLRGPWLKGADSRGAGGFGGNTNRNPLRGIGIDIQPALDLEGAPARFRAVFVVSYSGHLSWPCMYVPAAVRKAVFVWISKVAHMYPAY
jgi:hypothetical protein